MTILREPLFHFLALGALVFALYAAVSDERRGAGPNRITVSAGDVEQLRVLWSKQWQRPPTPEELQGLVEDHIRERVLQREALALGLDQNDTIVRRRLAQKMEFLIADLALPAQPAEEDLRAYYHENAGRYLEPARLSFVHIYFSRDQRGERLETEAQAVLETLRELQADASNVESYGDRILLRSRYDDASIGDVARDFGSAFAAGLSEVAPGGWAGPIASGYGVHLVYVSALEVQRQRAFEEVQQQVENDYLAERRREANETAYRKLREGYEIVVEAPGGAPAAPAGG